MEGDIVERLRRESNGVTVNLNPWPTMREAADAIALCRARVAELEDGRLRALLAATVGNLTVIGYENALAQVRAALSGTTGIASSVETGAIQAEPARPSDSLTLALWESHLVKLIPR